MTNPQLQFECRACSSKQLSFVLSLGRMPLANALPDEADLGVPDDLFPVDLFFCERCSLVQISETVEPERLFRHYLYLSSYSSTQVEHVGRLAAELVTDRQLDDKSLVVEIASNDGYLLKHYHTLHIPVLGIEPAVNVAKVAQEKHGIPTTTEFFGQQLALRLVGEGRRADVIHAHNVLAHVSDLNGFVAGIATLLKDDGVTVIEVPYVRDMVEKCAFDTIYHEHLCYFSLTALDQLFRRHGLQISDVRCEAVHGGTLRIYAGRAGQTQALPSVSRMLEEEVSAGVSDFALYRDFGRQVESVKAELGAVLRELKSTGNTLAAYGASAKATVLLNYCEIGAEIIDYVVDLNEHKIGRFIPGVRLPIFHPRTLLETAPNYTLLTTWNIAEEILAQQAEYRSRGGRFVQPIPKVAIL